MNPRWVLYLALFGLLAGCAGGGGVRDDAGPRDGARAPVAGSGERYALRGDAYPEDPPDVSAIPDAVPRIEPRSRGGNRPTYQVWGKSYRVLDDARGYTREGTASWYGEKFHGYATSNGEIYDMYKMSAAHRSLPLPTYARVTGLDSGRSVIVRVNDRGPFHSDREIDLSYAAAARLGFLERGTGRVRVEAIDPAAWLAQQRGGTPDASRAPSVAAPAAAPGEAPLFVQVAALSSAQGAQRLRTRLESTVAQPVRVRREAGLHRVQVGPLDHADQVASVRAALRQAGFAQTFIVKDAD